jgi:acetyl-CoA carboxylase biotin carboxyl carrier protein
MAENTASAKADDKAGGKRKGGTAGTTGEPSFDMDELRELMELVNEHGFTEFEFENENIRVRLGRNPSPQQSQSPVFATQQAGAIAASGPAGAEAAPVQADEDEGLYRITSPIVGTFYRAPGPDKEPYVKEGTSVTPDTVVCIVEAMKLMNEIQAEVSGEIAKIFVENGQPVEFGQPLFGIKK